MIWFKRFERLLAKDYAKHFTAKETPTRGRKVIPKEDMINERARNHGYFALLSNEVNDPYEALSLYRSKGTVKKAFGNLKERLDNRRIQVSSELSLNQKFPIELSIYKSGM